MQGAELAAASATGQAAGATIAAGYLSGFISSGNLNGAAMGALSAGVNFEIGGITNPYANVAAHAGAGGVLEVLQGGKFGHGFVSAGLSAAINPHIKLGNAFVNGTAASVVGGTISEVTGGKFANGAISTAFEYSFNFELHELTDKIVDAATNRVAKAMVDVVTTFVEDTKRDVSDYFSNNTFAVQLSVSGTFGEAVCLATPTKPMGLGYGLAVQAGVSLNSHGQVALNFSGVPMVGQGGGATIGVQYGLSKSDGGAVPSGWSFSHNHHYEVDFSVPQYPAHSVSAAADWNSSGWGGSLGSVRYSAGPIMFHGGGEQVNASWVWEKRLW